MINKILKGPGIRKHTHAHTHTHDLLLLQEALISSMDIYPGGFSIWENLLLIHCRGELPN